MTGDTSTEALLEMGRVIEDSRKYFDEVCSGIDRSAVGDLAYVYTFTCTRDTEPNGWEKIWGATTTVDFSIFNDTDHSIWIPKDGDQIPQDWMWHLDPRFVTKPIQNVTRYQAEDAKFLAARIKEARSTADGLANMQAEDFDAIGVIPTALGEQNEQLDALVETLSNANRDAQTLKENLQENWSSEGARLYADRIGDFKEALTQLSEASDAMKGANITVATHVNELMVAVLKLWEARIKGLNEAAISALGGGPDLVDLLSEPKVMSVLKTVASIVLGVLEKMATEDVESRISQLENLGDMANKLKPIEAAATAAGEVVWPSIPSGTEWVPR